MALKYQRILLKISGEALGGEKGTGVRRADHGRDLRRREEGP